jgi:hypothetical protein
MKKYRTRIEQYMDVNNIYPDEVVGASELDAELDIRGITGRGEYAIPGYCSRLDVDRCTNCPLHHNGLDCHGHPVA